MRDRNTTVRCATRAHAAGLLLAAALALPAGAVTTQMSETLASLGFSSDASQKVLSGEFVSTDVKSTSDREIAVGMAFLVDVPPKHFIDELLDGLMLRVDPNALASGTIAGPGAVSDFASVSLSVDGENLVASYLDAEAGEDLNLSAEEIAGFRALKARKALAPAVEQQLRENLLARLQSYRARGFDGIAPYAREDGKTRSPGAELRAASEATVALKKHVPDFYRVLTGYPKAPAKGLEERFHWMSYRAHGTPVFILTHAMALAKGDAFAVCQRQFYVSGSYNAEQAVAGFLPVERGTLVVYVNRTSTDQVAGFGGSTKRAIGEKLMASQLRELFTKLRKAAK